jgi:hypothetical protein
VQAVAHLAEQLLAAVKAQVELAVAAMVALLVKLEQQTQAVAAVAETSMLKLEMVALV